MPFNVSQPIYQRLRTIHAERRRPVVFWVGAGLSQPANLPSWPGLRDMLLARAIETAATLPEAEGRVKEQALEKITSKMSLWDAFQTLKKEMGRVEFREEIREIFKNSTEASIPEIYTEIWNLPGVRGMLTLNLDEFASRSHRRTRLTEDPAVFFGRDAPDYAHILAAGRAFIGNLHGVMDANNSWVFTRDEISQLVSTPGYKEFVGFVFGQMTVVFLGISAEDGAAGGFLETLTRSGLDLGSHFWITSRTDATTHGWAAEAGLGVIRYIEDHAAGGAPDHTTPLLEMFADMRAYISRDARVSPLIPDIIAIASLPSVKELRTKDDDELRGLLSGYAKVLLEKEGSSDRINYNKFLREYAPCIHQAWYITSDPPFNKFYNYHVEERISSSPFSTVWRLRAEDGSSLALKVLRIENLENGPEIESLRRGIQSLGYLTKAAIPGTATLVTAYEIPTSVIMEFVDGENLQDLANSGSFDLWHDGLPILMKVCEHLRYGHNLPQGVLHRDVRPSNIMVPNFYWQVDFQPDGPQKHEVKLLNYDMSWHANAKGQTIAGNLQESGYYAPEQMSSLADQSRTTLVDSYGVGMCIYYTFTRQAPPAAGSKSTDWPSLLDQGFRPNARLTWRSAPVRLRRLMERATSPRPEERPMIDQIGAELRLLQQAITGETRNLPADFWAEDLISRSEEAEYKTVAGGTGFLREPREGRSIILEGDLRNNLVILKFRNQAMASTNRSGLDRVWADKLQRARGILSSSGWSIRDETRYGNMELLLSADVSLDVLRAKFTQLLDGLQRGLTQVRIE